MDGLKLLTFKYLSFFSLALNICPVSLLSFIGIGTQLNLYAFSTHLLYQAIQTSWYGDMAKSYTRSLTDIFNG